jgi:ubiquinone/menaquinone biosynthesis C-methylase UbiE
MPEQPAAPSDPALHQAALRAQARFWDRVAKRYAAAQIGDPAGYEATIERTRQLLMPHHTVVELGCGTGTTALRLAVGVQQMVASDVSAQMIGIARGKLAAAPLPPLRFVQADAHTALAQEAPCDVVLAFNVLHLVPDLEALLGAMHAALKPGGLVISKTPCLSEMNPLIPRVAVPLARLVGLAPPVQSFNAEWLVAAFEHNGFATEAVERHGSKRKDPRVFIVARKLAVPLA